MFSITWPTEMKNEWNKAVADDSEGLAPETVFDRLYKKYSDLTETPSN